MQTVAVRAHLESPTRSTVEAREFEIVIDEPESQDGTNKGQKPLEYLLAAHAGCLNVTASLVAADMGLEIETLDIEIEGDFDADSFQTARPDEGTGVRDIEVSLDVGADADEETLRAWAERVEARCPVADDLRNRTGIERSIEPG